jgi:hypothetical protein
MTMTAVEVEHLKRAPAAKGIIPAILHRWSPRSFSDRPVSPKDLDTVLKPPTGPPPLTTSSHGASSSAPAVPKHTRRSSRA